FTHLNTHSIFSKMQGTSSLRELLAQTKKYHMTHLALTEVNGIWGFIRFVQFAREFEIRPIAGVNLITDHDDVVLLVENQQGYENMCRIISDVHERTDVSIADLLQSRCEGLFILAHEEKSLRLLSKLIASTHLFVELRPGVEERMAQALAKQFQLEMVTTGDVYFLSPKDQPAHKVLRAIEQNTTLSALDLAEVKSDAHYFRSEKEMATLFPNSLDAINNAYYLAERCKTDWQFLNTIFPNMNLKSTHRANEKLRKLVYEGAEKRYRSFKIEDRKLKIGKQIENNEHRTSNIEYRTPNPNPPTLSSAVKKRIEHELAIITEKGFAPYFLVVWDIVKQTNATIGRGSGAASIVSYCLFITQVDPLKYNLQFERFIHPERVDMPDIDIDFPWDERDDIIDYVFQKYGKERTAMVSNQVFLQPRSAVREAAKVYGLSNEEIKEVTKRIGWHSRRSDLLSWLESDNRFKNLNIDSTLKEILKISEKIIGAFRVSSVHPGGVVIVPDEIRKYIPVLMATKGVQILEWEKDQTEDSGLLKIDLLGNRSLAVVRDTLKQMGVYRSEYVNYHRIPSVGDKKTESLMKAGKTMGIFYIESPATRQLLAKAGRVDFEHVVIYSSIIRPAANRFTNLMLERIHGKPWKLPHPDLHFLNESYGIMVYEEQVSMTARELAGFGYAESDYIRKVISRPSLEHLVPLWRKKFIDGMLKRGYDKKLALEMWSMVESFSGYSFCKPHSASYAMLSFSCAYLKAHFPAEFLAAVVSNQGGFYSAYAYLSEARRWGITILPPHINCSCKEYRGAKKRIRMGFMAIANLKEKAIMQILEERKSGDYESLKDFFQRTDLDLADAMSLTNAGCFTELEPNLTHQQIAFRIASHYLQNGEKGEDMLPPINESEISHEEKIRLERESFGFPISEHPLIPWLPFFEGRIKKAEDIPKYVGKTINLAGVLITTKVTSTRKREPMEFITLEDETDIYECVMFPDAFTQYGDLLNWEKLFIIRGKVEVAFGVYSITIEKMGSMQKM
ncbi:MAG: DNA polymerase III subunit alpha, partial [Candidatus Marinimicrobia bacterium]|nr:DNA polymerase III subunit alpha [Candidatus Neomarinimicrobiota bacterium]